MSEEAKLLIDQIERMNNFYMWSIGIFITLIISFVGFFSFVQFKLSEKQKKNILRETEEFMNSNVSELSKKLDLKSELSGIDVNFNYCRNIALLTLDGNTNYASPSLSISIFFKTISSIDTFILKYHNNVVLEEETIERLSKIISSSIFFLVRLIDAAEKEATKLEEFEKISNSIAEYKQCVYRLFYNNLFQFNEDIKNSVSIFEKYILQVEEKIKSMETELTETPN